MRYKVLSLILVAAGFAAGWFLRPLTMDPGTGPGQNLDRIAGAAGRSAPDGGASAALPGSPGAAASPTASVAQAADTMRKIFKEKDSLKRSAALRSLIANTPAAKVDNLVQAYIICMHEGLPTRGLGELVYRRDGAVKGEAGMDALPKEPNGIPNYVMKHRLRGWASADPEACQQWINALEPGRTQNELLDDWMNGLKDTDPEKLRALLPQLDPTIQAGLMGNIVDDAVQNRGLSEMAEWFRTSGAALSPEARERAVSLTIDAFTQNQTPEDLEQTVAFLKQMSAPGDEKFAKGLKQMVWRIARYSPGGTLDLLNEYLPQNTHLAEAKGDFIKQCVSVSSNNTVNDIGNWLNAHRTSPIYNDVAGAFLTHVKSIDLEGAKAWANAITDQALREEMLSRLNEGSAGP